MATIEEIREDFIYVYLVELAFLISLIFNFAYLNLWNEVILYSLIFWAIFMFEDKVMKSLILQKTRDLKRIFELINRWKRYSKIGIAFYLSLMIVLSSWGIIAYISRYVQIEAIKIIVEILPYYIAIYVGWLISLTYMKSRYTKLVLYLLKKKRN